MRGPGARAATLKDERRLRRFRAFINEPNGSDEGSHLYVLEREQIRPATPEEIAAAEAGESNTVLLTGAKIPVGKPSDLNPVPAA